MNWLEDRPVTAIFVIVVSLMLFVSLMLYLAPPVRPQSDKYKGDYQTQHIVWRLDQIEKKIDALRENMKPPHATGVIPPKELRNGWFPEGDFVEHAAASGE